MGCKKLSYYQEEDLEKSTVLFFGPLAQKRGQQIFCIDYYPFGLTFNSSERSGFTSNLFLYQGKELQSDLGLDTYDFEARMYDPVLGRTFQLDPHLENYYDWSPYSWTGNNPIIMIDPTGMDWFVHGTTGDMLYVKGVSNLEDAEIDYGEDWNNFGSDDMFGEEVMIGEENILERFDYQFGPSGAKSFMEEQGFTKAIETVVEEKNVEGKFKESPDLTNITTTKSESILEENVTYVEPERIGAKEGVGYKWEGKHEFIKMQTTRFNVYTKFPDKYEKNKIQVNGNAGDNLKKDGANLISEFLIKLFKK